MPLITTSTKVLLQSDDSLWYYLELASDGGFLTAYCDGVSISPPGGANAYAVLQGSDGNTYRLSLATVVTADGDLVGPSLTVSPSPETVDSLTLELSGTTYALTAVVDSGVVTLLIDVSAGTPPTITTNPSNASFSAGDTFHISVVATGDAPLSYQWRKGGVNISGETSADLYFAPADLADTGSYDCVVTNAFGSATSTAASVTIAAQVPTQGSPNANGSVPGVTITVGVSFGDSLPSTETINLNGNPQITVFVPLTGGGAPQGFIPL